MAENGRKSKNRRKMNRKDRYGRVLPKQHIPLDCIL